MWDYLPPLMQGAWVTVQLTLWSTLLGALCAFVFGLGRLSANPLLKSVSVSYIEIFRGTSLLVQMFWIFFALPLLGVRLSPITAGILALSLNIGAYGAEVVRGAVQAVPNVELSRLDYRPDGTLAATVTADTPATLQALRRQLETGGLQVQEGSAQALGARPSAELLLRPS